MASDQGRRPERSTARAIVTVGSKAISRKRIQLLVDLREQILSLDATLREETAYGRMYEIAGPLKGPNGKVLDVRSIWIVEAITGRTKFVTLFPDKR